MTRTPVQLALLAALLAVAAPASAIYIDTPLLLRASATHGEVGDTLRFDVEPRNETVAPEWAGRVVRAILSYDDAPRRDDPDAPTHDGEWARVPLGEPFALDEGARGSFSWTIPAELDGKNVGILLETEDGKLLATADVAVGDAEPVMRILAGPGAEEPVGEEPVRDDAERVDAHGDDRAPAREVPLPGAIAVGAVALAGGLALALRRKA